MIMATGPLTGTMASTRDVTGNHQGTVDRCHRLFQLGWLFWRRDEERRLDMIIFEGKAANPVYLVIQNDQAEIKDASHMKNGWETDDIIHATYQDPQMRIAYVGRPAETVACMPR